MDKQAYADKTNPINIILYASVKEEINAVIILLPLVPFLTNFKY
jgi:hypothetical protein